MVEHLHKFHYRMPLKILIFKKIQNLRLLKKSHGWKINSKKTPKAKYFLAQLKIYFYNKNPHYDNAGPEYKKF